MFLVCPVSAPHPSESDGVHDPVFELGHPGVDPREVGLGTPVPEGHHADDGVPAVLKQEQRPARVALRRSEGRRVNGDNSEVFNPRTLTFECSFRRSKRE